MERIHFKLWPWQSVGFSDNVSGVMENPDIMFSCFTQTHLCFWANQMICPPVHAEVFLGLVFIYFFLPSSSIQESSVKLFMRLTDLQRSVEEVQGTISSCLWFLPASLFCPSPKAFLPACPLLLHRRAFRSAVMNGSLWLQCVQSNWHSAHHCDSLFVFLSVSVILKALHLLLQMH